MKKTKEELLKIIADLSYAKSYSDFCSRYDDSYLVEPYQEMVNFYRKIK